MPPDLDQIRAKIWSNDYLLTLHASDRAAQRAIFGHEIEEAILDSEVIEDYPNDKYGPSCLIMGKTLQGKVLHIQVSYPPKVSVITVYVPSLTDWEADLKTRKSE